MAKTQTLSFPLRLPDNLQASDKRSAPVLAVGQITFAGDDGMAKGQTYRASVERVATCDIHTHQEQTRACLWLRLRAPDETGKWRWGIWSSEIPLPANVLAYLEQGATPQAPTLREVGRSDGGRMAVLDLNLEVPAKYVTPLEQERRVLGFDWGIRSLITVSILEKPGNATEPYRQVSRPLQLSTGGIDGRQARLRREIDRLKTQEQRTRTFGLEFVDLAGLALRLSFDLRRELDDAQDHRARARRAGSFPQLAQ